MTAEDFARAFAPALAPDTDPESWTDAWVAELPNLPGWRYRHPDGAHATFKPDERTAQLLRALARRANEDGFAEARFADLAHDLALDDPARLGSHMRALRQLGLVDRFRRDGKCNLYRLALERPTQHSAVPLTTSPAPSRTYR